VLSERQAVLTAAVASLREGDTVVGNVSRLEDYGAFIALVGQDGAPNGVQGLLHKSEMSWGMVMTVDEVVCVGEWAQGGQLNACRTSPVR
jgi:ribosomal protein S1